MALRQLWFFARTEAELEALWAVFINISPANLYSLPSALWICRFPAVPSLFSTWSPPCTAVASSVSPVPSASSASTPTPAMPQDLPSFPILYCHCGFLLLLSLHEATSLFLACSHRHTSELSRNSDLISLLSLLLVLVHLTGETRFAGTRRRLQRKRKLPNELCCLQALSAVHLGGEKGELGCIFGT